MTKKITKTKEKQVKKIKDPVFPKYHYMEQRSNAWLKIRELHLTASHASTIAVGGKGLESLCRKMVLEYFLPDNIDNFITEDMQRGIFLEDEALELYSKVMKKKVKKVGFVEGGDYKGCSPDGLVGKVGGVEIKSPNDKTYLSYLLDKEIPKDYYLQCQMCLLLTGRQWWDLFLYNPHYEQSYIRYRILPDGDAFTDLTAGLRRGEERIKEIIEVFHSVKK